MNIKAAVLLFLAIFLLEPAQARQSPGYQQIVNTLEQVVPSGNLLPSEIIYFKYGKEVISLKKSAFSQFVQQVIAAQNDLEQEFCHSSGCSHSHDGKTNQRLLQLLKLRVVEISGFAYKGLKQYGLPYAVFLVVFESIEHTVFAWLPPFCPFYHAAYFATDNFLRKFKGLVAKNTGLGFAERSKVLMKSVYLDLMFWSRLREGVLAKTAASPTEKPNEFNLGQELDYVFSSDLKEKRYWTAKSQVRGFQLVNEYLNGLVSERLKSGEITTKQAFRIFGILGTLNREIQKYLDHLRFYSLTDDAERFVEQKQTAQEKLRSLLSFFIQAQSFLTDEGPRLDDAIARSSRTTCKTLFGFLG